MRKLLLLFCIQRINSYGHLAHTVSGLIADLLIKSQTSKYVHSLVKANISQIATW